MAVKPPDIPISEQFVHLHLHTEYSLLDGANRIDRLIERVKELGMHAVAITDHGNLFGALAFQQHALAAGVKPILGVEAYVAQGDRTDRTHTGVADGGYHLVLLAETDTGWSNLLKLASEAYLTGFYYKPRVDRALLEECGEGLIAISGHLGSELAHHLVEYEKTNDEAHYERALDAARWHHAAFAPTATGPCFYVELQRHIAEQNAINPHLVRLARELDLPLVADNDAHFLTADAHDAHDTLICISTGKLKSEPNRLRYPEDLYVKSPQQMRELFDDLPEAIDNTVAIADRCHAQIRFDSHTPVVKVIRPAKPRAYDGEEDLTEWFKAFCADYQLEPFDASNEEGSDEIFKADCDAALRELCEAGLIWRYGAALAPGAKAPDDEAGRDRLNAIRARLDRELSVLIEKSISAYFLIVWDFVSWGRRQGIPSQARGSGVGTMVGYLLGLSNACPVEHGLLFERFTDPDRSEYPDIDIDLCQDGRARVINYVRQKYGHVAQIITFGTLKARAAIRDVGRVLDLPLPEVDRLAKLVPEELKITLDKALAQEPALKKEYDEDERVKRLIDNARQIEGQARHASVHAAGVIVATRPLHEIVPLYKAPGSDDIVTQWDGPSCEKIGLLKMDFLGLRTLSVIERARQLVLKSIDDETIWRAVGRTRGDGPHPLDLDRISYDDPRVFSLFQRADTAGVFQFESGGMRRLLQEMKPDQLGDLIAANALFRPGPMDLIPTYNKRKHGQEPVPSVHAIVDKHTAATYGVMVYQEQVMQIVHELGGVPLREAYTLIKAISKKKHKIIDAERARFMEGAQRQGLASNAAEELFELILKFAGYGFNKSHSTAYAIVAYQTAYLKTYFPNQYMAAFLTFESAAQKTSDWTPYLDDCRKIIFPDGRVGVEVKPPDFNRSDADFSIVFEESEPRDNLHGHVRFGLAAIKGVGSKAIAAIVAEREKSGAFASLHDFCERVPPGVVNKATIEALIRCGAMDSAHGRENRAALSATLESAMAAGQTRARDKAAGQGALFNVPQAGAPEAPAAREPTPLARVEPWTELEMLKHEKDTLGLYVSSHPLDHWSKRISDFATISTATLKDATGGEVVIAGLVQSIRLIVTRNGRSAGKKMAILALEDHQGVIEAVLFPETYANCAESLSPDSIVFLVGKADRSRGEPQIIVEKVVPIERAPAELAGCVELVLDDEKLNGQSVATAQSIAGLVGSEGRRDLTISAVPLRLVVRTSGGRVVLQGGARSRCAPSDVFLTQLEGLVGAGNVRVLGRHSMRRAISS